MYRRTADIYHTVLRYIFFTEDMHMIKLSPSILSADFSKLGQDIVAIDRSEAEYIHIDVMDGMFVPNISFGMPVIKAIRKYTDKVFDVHMMVQEPSRYIADMKEAGADLITVHAEACTHLHRTIQEIKRQGCMAGVALNPATSLSALDYVLEDVDLVLLMTVDPGFGGANYIPAVTPKITKLREIITERGLSVKLEIDGGITLNNVKDCILAGADTIVAGTAVFKGNISENIENFHNIFREVTHG